MNILGIETSCDETAVAIYSSEQGILAHEIYSQIAMHAEYGGVVPELASRDHIRKCLPLVDTALQKSGLKNKEIDGIAFTRGPGLIGALMVGATFAQSLGWAWQVPRIGIHHLEAHLLVVLLEPEPPPFPFIALLVSGGHTMLIAVRGIGDYQILGETLDDAVGEAFDKTAKLLGLSYPGGPALAALAEKGNPGRFHFPRPMIHHPGFDFSFSGLKTFALNCIKQHERYEHKEQQAQHKHYKQHAQYEQHKQCKQNEQQEYNEQNEQHEYNEQTRADIASSFQEAVIESLWIKTRQALDAVGFNRLAVVGGVSANRQLRHYFQMALQQRGGKVYFPRPEFSTDNGVMVAYTGYLRLKAGQCDDFRITVDPRWSLQDLKKLDH